MKCTGEVGDKSGNLGNVSDERTLALICAVMGNHGRVFCWFQRLCCICERAQLCLTHCNPMDCSPPGSFVRGVSQAGILRCVVISSSRIKPKSPASAGGFFTTKPPGIT